MLPDHLRSRSALGLPLQLERTRRAAHASARERRGRAVRVHRPELGHPREPGAARVVRPRLPELSPRGRSRRRGAARDPLQHGPLRDRLVGTRQRRHQSAARSVRAAQSAAPCHRHCAAGDPERALPRTAHGQPSGPSVGSRLSGRRRSGDRHLEPLLLRQLRRRHPRRHPHGGRARFPPGGARGRRNGLLQPARAPRRRLLALRQHRLEQLSGPVAAPAHPRLAAAAVGPRGPRRVRTADDLRTAPRYPTARRANAGRLRRFRSQYVCGGRRGAHDRRVGVRARARS